MSDSYTIGDVIVTPTGGGWYELGRGGAVLDKVQGKENADARALELASPKGGDPDQSAELGSMPGQGDIAAALEAKQKTEADEIAELKAKLAEQEARTAAAEKQLETKTVTTDGGEVPTQPTKVPAGVPRKFSGVLDDKAKAELKRLGVETTRIVLEENEAIPPTGLFLGHNGRGYMIIPGEEVDVPDFLLGVLNDAVMSTPVVDSKSQKVLGYRNRMRYPYRKV